MPYEFSYSNDKENYSETYKITTEKLTKSENITEANASTSYNGKYVKINLLVR